MSRPCSFLLVLAILLGACTKDGGEVPATALIVRVSAERELQSALRRMRLRTAGAKGPTWALRSEKSYQAEALTWPVDLVLVPSSDWTPDHTLEIVVDAFDAADRPLVQARVLTSFQEQQTRILTVSLARCGAMTFGDLCEANPDCYGPSCRTCVQGSCQMTPVTSVVDLPVLVPETDVGDAGSPMDASGSPEAGPVNAPMDASVDAAPMSTGIDASMQGEAGPISMIDANSSDALIPIPVDDGGALGQPDAAPCVASTEVCDGKDNDCDGDIDEQVKTRCWADSDGDGFAAQNASVMESCDQCGAKQTSVAPAAGKTDCDDADAMKSPGATDVCGDSLDNDCDGSADEEANNACNGPCTTRLPGRPGDPCSNGLKGACARNGVYECAADKSMRCTAMSVAGTTEVCGDNSDNDCDGTVDNGCVKNACGGWSQLANAKGAACTAGTGSCASSGTYQCQGTDATVCNATPKQSRMWYKDCDQDGFAANLTGQQEACAKPAVSAGCDWTITEPTGSKVDCDNNNGRRFPGAGYGVTGGGDADLDCDGSVASRLEFVASSNLTYHSGLTYNLCPVFPPNQLTQATCGCWYITGIAFGFRGYNPQVEARQSGSWSPVDPLPCSAAADDVGLAMIVKWNSFDAACSDSPDISVALRKVCK